jgi:hypothetical protein
MQITKALREKAAQLLAADSATLAPASDANKLMLLKAQPAENENVAIGDLSEADFDGSAALLCGTGTQPEGLDPNSADAVISIKPPAGGFRWETTGGTNLPQTIYGVALVNNDKSVLFGVQRITPVTLTATNQVVEVGPIQIRQMANSMT